MKTNIESTGSLACKLSVLSREITAAAARLLAPFGVTPSQANVFYALLQGETSPSVIATAIGIDASSLSRLLRKLEQQGHIERSIDLENRTRITLRLTESGRRLARRIDPHAEQIQQRIERALSPQELDCLRRALGAISDAMAPAGDQPLGSATEPADVA